MFLLYTSDQAKQALHLFCLTSSSLMGPDKWMFSWMTGQTQQTACTCSTEAADAQRHEPTLADACHWCRWHRRHEPPPIKLPAADSSVSNSSLHCWKTVTRIFTVFCCSRWRYRAESVHSSCLKNVSPVWTCVANLMSFNASLVSCANCALPVCF